MPELPDLAHIEAKLRPALVGQEIADARTGDPTVLRIMIDEPLGAALRGRRITSVDRRGHFMRFGIDGDRVIVINAMLVGKYRLLAPAELGGKKDPRALGLALALASGNELQYVDDKRMGKVYVARAADENADPGLRPAGRRRDCRRRSRARRSARSCESGAIRRACS